MANADDEVPTHLYVDSVMASESDAKINGNGEPLVLDFATIYDEHDPAGYRAPPLTPPDVRPYSTSRRGSWLSGRDITPAPSPPDLTRRDIHVPTRTR